MKLSNVRRAALAGYRRARMKAKAELARQASDFETELLALRDEFNELALAHYRKCLSDAIDEALIERSARPDMLLN